MKTDQERISDLETAVTALSSIAEHHMARLAALEGKKREVQPAGCGQLACQDHGHHRVCSGCGKRICNLCGLWSYGHALYCKNCKPSNRPLAQARGT